MLSLQHLQISFDPYLVGSGSIKVLVQLWIYLIWAPNDWSMRDDIVAWCAWAASGYVRLIVGKFSILNKITAHIYTYIRNAFRTWSNHFIWFLDLSDQHLGPTRTTPTTTQKCACMSSVLARTTACMQYVWPLRTGLRGTQYTRTNPNLYIYGMIDSISWPSELDWFVGAKVLDEFQALQDRCDPEIAWTKLLS